MSYKIPGKVCFHFNFFPEKKRMATCFFSGLFSMFSAPFVNLFIYLSQLCFSLYQHFHKQSTARSGGRTIRKGGERKRRRRGRGRRAAKMTLPEDMIMNILARLPVKSLLRFRSVCKAWKTLIRDPHFISEHLHLNGKENQISAFLLVKHRHRLTLKPVISLLSHGTHDHILSNLEIPSLMDSSLVKFVGCQNGLLCLANDSSVSFGSSIMLWNPAMRQFRVLPKCLIDSAYELNAEISSIVHGFGYHPPIDDYKFLRIVFISSIDEPCIRAEVYSLKMDCWREIDTIYFRCYESCVPLNGALHWLAYGRGNYELIVSFDMSSEVFQRLLLPEILSSLGNQMCTKLASLKESLYLIAYSFEGLEKQFHVWRMHGNDADEVVWTKELTVLDRPLLGLERPLGCGFYGEIYMESRRGDLVLYNPSTQQTRDLLQIRGLRCTLEVHVYVESLVSPN